MTTARTTQEHTAWAGWVYFAATMMIIGGALWAIVGLFAVIDDKWIVFGANNTALLDISGWGWVHLVLGVVMVIAGTMVAQGDTFGRVLAVIMAGLSILVNFVWLPVYPAWSLVVMAIDVFIIYAVIVHGREVERE